MNNRNQHSINQKQIKISTIEEKNITNFKKNRGKIELSAFIKQEKNSIHNMSTRQPHQVKPVELEKGL